MYSPQDQSQDESNWVCPRCGNINFPFRQSCNMRKCGFPRPKSQSCQESVSYLPSGPVQCPVDRPLSPQSKDEVKQYKLFESSSTLNGLDSIINPYFSVLEDAQVQVAYSSASLVSSIPSPSHNAEDWVCPQCGNLNYSFRTQCNMRKCRAPRVLSPLSAMGLPVVHPMAGAAGLVQGVPSVNPSSSPMSSFSSQSLAVAAEGAAAAAPSCPSSSSVDGSSGPNNLSASSTVLLSVMASEGSGVPTSSGSPALSPSPPSPSNIDSPSHSASASFGPLSLPMSPAAQSSLSSQPSPDCSVSIPPSSADGSGVNSPQQQQRMMLSANGMACVLPAPGQPTMYNPYMVSAQPNAMGVPMMMAYAAYQTPYGYAPYDTTPWHCDANGGLVSGGGGMGVNDYQTNPYLAVNDENFYAAR